MICVYTNLYEYDVKSCFYNILKKINYNGIDKLENYEKLKRNIAIGIMQKNNPRLGKYLNRVSKNLIDCYIKENNLKNENIILRNKDGIITDTLLNNINIGIELSYRGFILKAIRGKDGNFLLYYDDYTVRIMGMKPFVNDIFLKKFINIPEDNKKQYLNKLNDLRYEILKECDDKDCYTMVGKNDTIIIPTKDNTFINLNKSFYEKVSLNTIDRNFVWNVIMNFVSS